MLWHRIAYDWGVTVSELQERMTSAEFTELCAYLRKEPHGYEIENFRAGVVAATIANVAPRKRGAKPLKPSDFYPNAGRKRTTMTASELRERHAMRKRMKAEKTHG